TAKQRMRNSSHVRAILEMALVRLCQLDELVPITQVAQWLSKEGAAPAAAKSAAPASFTSRPHGPPEAEKKKLSPDSNSDVSISVLSLSADNLAAIWQQVLANSGFAVQSDLRRAINVAISAPNSLVLSVPRRYNAFGSVFQETARLAKV